MRVFAKLALAAVALAALTTTASAAVIFTSPTGGVQRPLTPLWRRRILVWNFEGGAGRTPRISLCRRSYFHRHSASRRPLGDATHYGAAGTGTFGTPAQGTPNTMFATKPGYQF